MFYKLKANQRGMDLSDANRMKQLEDENAKLTRLSVDATLDNVVLKDFLGKPGDADCAAGCSTAGAEGSSDLPTSGRRPDRCRSEDGAAREAAR